MNFGIPLKKETVAPSVATPNLRIVRSWTTTERDAETKSVIESVVHTLYALPSGIIVYESDILEGVAAPAAVATSSPALPVINTAKHPRYWTEDEKRKAVLELYDQGKNGKEIYEVTRCPSAVRKQFIAERNNKK